MHWKNLVCLAAFAAVLLPSSALAKEPTEEWVRTYDNGFTDAAEHIATDSEGNVYVAGISVASSGQIDWATVKYDSEGNEQWVRRHEIGRPKDIAVDSKDNIYVTGLSVTGTSRDFTTIKYDKDGNVLQVMTFDKGGTDQATTLAIDSQDNVYVAGLSTYSSPGFTWSIFTIKYDENGNELWVKESRSGNASSLAVDSSGNVYLTTWSGSSLPGYTIKYDTNGNTLWVRYYPAKFNDLAVDSSGNVYVVGGFRRPPTFKDEHIAIKYAPDGTLEWVKTIFTGMAYDVTVDSLDNVYVAGLLFADDGPFHITTKYDKDGNELWFKEHDAESFSLKNRSIAVDSSDNIYAIITASDLGNRYCATVKYDADGNESWVLRYDRSRINVCRALALDSADNVYVTGSDLDSNFSADFLTIKYSQGPSTIADIIAIIEDMLSAGDITNAGVANALIAQLTNAEANLESSPVSAQNMLEAAINLLEAQSGKKVSAGAAEELIGYLDDIIAGL